MTRTTKKVALTIAGSDPSGGAGIAADLKTFMANGVYGCSVITALTAQNTKEYWATQPVAGHMVTDQLLSVLTDIRPDAVKIGMLPNAGIMGEVAEVLGQEELSPVVVDPVMVSTSGKALMADNARKAFVQKILPLCDLVTPNIPETVELLKLSGQEDMAEPFADEKEWMQQAAKVLSGAFGINVLVKGAWGCGAFGNKPEVVAGAFRKILVQERFGTAFDRVRFALYGNPKGKNYCTFASVFGAEQE